MTLSTLLADCYRRLGYASSPDSAVTTRLTAFLNETQRDVLSEPGMQHLLDGTATFASVASTPQYALPPSVARIKTIREITNDIGLGSLTPDMYRLYDPDPTANTGTSTHYVDLGLTAIATQPSDASEIFVDSTAAGDTQTAYIEGYTTGGHFRSKSVTVTGTTAVTFDATITTWIEITKFYLSSVAVGIVTLHEDASGGTELARIGIGNTHARYKKIALWPCPSTAITYYVDYERDVQDMANANDEPVLPVRFHPLLAIGARMKEYEKQSDSRYALAAAEYHRRLAQLKFFLFSSMDYKRPGRPSRLGPYYPA